MATTKAGLRRDNFLLNSTMRRVASRHSSTSATRAMRIAVVSRIHAVRIARQITAWQYGDIIFGIQALGVFGVGDPAICRHRPTGKSRRPAGARRARLASSGVTVLEFRHGTWRGCRSRAARRSRPRLLARLHRPAHGAAVVCAVQQEALDDRGVAGDEAGAHARHVASAWTGSESTTRRAEAAASELMRGFQPAQRRFGSSK